MDHVHICQDGDGRGAGRRGPGCRVVSAVGSRRVEAGECKEEMQPTIGDRRCEVTRQSRYRLRGVRVGEASNPGPQSTRIVSEVEPILPGRFSPRRHGDSAESVLIPGHSWTVSSPSRPRGAEDVVDCPMHHWNRCIQFRSPLHAKTNVGVASPSLTRRLRRQGQVAFRSGQTTSRAIC